MPACEKCGVQMELKKIRVDDYYRYYWQCRNPECRRIVESPFRHPVKEKQHKTH